MDNLFTKYLSKVNTVDLTFVRKIKNTNEGNLRESFFYNQVSTISTVCYTQTGDFFVDNKYTFEIGGKGKGKQQISNLQHAYIAADNIEIGTENKIPLWLLGFLY